MWSSQIVCVASLCVSSPQARAVGAVNCLKVCTTVCAVCVSKSEMTSQPDACWDSRPKEETVGGGKALAFAHTGYFFLPHCCCVAAASGFLLTLDLVLSAVEENLNTKQQIHQYSPQRRLYLLCFRPLQGGNHYMTRADPMLTAPLL